MDQNPLPHLSAKIEGSTRISRRRYLYTQSTLENSLMGYPLWGRPETQCASPHFESLAIPRESRSEGFI